MLCDFKPAITDFMATRGQQKQAVNTTSTYHHLPAAAKNNTMRLVKVNENSKVVAGQVNDELKLTELKPRGDAHSNDKSVTMSDPFHIIV